MILPPPVPGVDKQLGGTTIYEEYRGNFAEARQAAEQQLATARQSGSRSQLADALFSRGVVHLLQGEPAAALALLQEIHKHVPRDHRRRLRAVNYEFQAMLVAWNYYPSGGVANSPELTARVDWQKYVAEWTKRKEVLLSQVHDPDVLLEGWLINQWYFQLGARMAYASKEMAIKWWQSFAASSEKARQRFEQEQAHSRVLGLLDQWTAELVCRAGNMEAAVELLGRVDTLFRTGQDAVGSASCAMKFGDWLIAWGSTPAVWSCWLFEGGKDNALLWEIESLEAMSRPLRPAEARQAYEYAEQLYRLGEAPRGLAAIELRYCYLATLDRKYSQAGEHASRAFELFSNAGDVLGAQVARAHRALCRIGMRSFPLETTDAEAIGTWGSNAGSFSFSLGLGLFFARVGRHWLVRDGDVERALACFRLAECVYRLLGARLCQARTHTDQAMTYKLIGEWDAFTVTVERGLDICESIIDSQLTLAREGWQQAAWLGIELLQVANALRDPATIDRAIERLQSLLSRLTKIKLVRRPRKKFAGDTLAYWHSFFTQSLKELMKKEGSDTQLFPIGLFLVQQLQTYRFISPLYRGRLARDTGDQEQAEYWFDQAQQALPSSGQADRMFHEAMLAGYRQQFAEAAKTFQHYIEHQLANIAATQLPHELGANQWRYVYRQAFTCFTSFQHFTEAEAAFKVLVQADGPEWWARDERAWETLSCCGEMYEGLGRWREAFDYHDQAIEIFEQRRGQLLASELKAALASGSSTQFMFFIAARTALKARETALAAGDVESAAVEMERAFSYIERGKARSLLDLMAGGGLVDEATASENQPLRNWRQANTYLATRRGLLAREHAEQQPDRTRIAALHKEIAAAETELHKAEAELAAADPRLYQAQTAQSSVLSLTDIRGALPEDTALLQYAFLGEDLLAWAITREGVAQVHRARVETGKLKRLIIAFHQGCEQPGHYVEDLSHELSDMLLAPLAETITDHRQLIIAPYGSAHVLPFHALPWKGQPLVVAHAISYLPSASTIKFLSRPTFTRDTRVLAVGDPTNMFRQEPGSNKISQLHQLQATAVEAAYIASLFPGSEALTREQATVSAIRERLHTHAFPLVHFATHGFLSPDVPLLSSILLANGNALSVYDLMGLHLDAELVVLSACRTAQGATTGGDDVLGLTRGLLAAGARATVVSLWPVDDVATSLLMGEFYRQLQVGTAPSVALQAAQLYLQTLTPDDISHELERLNLHLRAASASREALEELDRQRARHLGDEAELGQYADYRHPYFWAPFVLIGL